MALHFRLEIGLEFGVVTVAWIKLIKSFQTIVLQTFF